VWNGYMEGAVRSGEDAAGDVLARLGVPDPLIAPDRTT